MQRCGAKKSAGAVVVLSSDRWTKVLVRRQAHAVEIAAGMAKGSIPETRFRRSRCKLRQKSLPLGSAVPTASMQKRNH